MNNAHNKKTKSDATDIPRFVARGSDIIQVTLSLPLYSIELSVLVSFMTVFQTISLGQPLNLYQL
jgi:hypothetical protein